MFKPKFTGSKAGFSTGFIEDKSSWGTSFDSIVTLKGEDGFSPIVELKQEENGYTLTITDAEGEKSAYLKNGEVGPAGPVGPVGPTGPIGLTGPMGPMGPKPEKGKDYLTEQEKKEMANDIIGELPIEELQQADTEIGEKIAGLEKTIDELEEKIDQKSSGAWYVQETAPENAPIGALWFCTSDSITYAEEEKY